jgi:hypothetical protein
MTIRLHTRCSVALLLTVALALACGSEEPEPSASAPAAGAAGAGSAAQRPAADLSLPPEGEVAVSFGTDGIVALANRAPRRRVLEAIAKETGLVVVAFVAGGDPDGRVTMQSRSEAIEVVLARALSGVPFSVEPLEGERQRLTLVVGRREGAVGPAPARRAAGQPRVRAEPPQVVDEDALALLASPDAEERAEGVEFVDVATAAGFAAVVERLANDPDAAVRAAAAETLGDGDVGAVPSLVAALGDSDTRVVLAALESLELLGDASTVPELAPALQHPDAAVRQRAAEVSEFLE